MLDTEYLFYHCTKREQSCVLYDKTSTRYLTLRPADDAGLPYPPLPPTITLTPLPDKHRERDMKMEWVLRRELDLRPHGSGRQKIR